MMRLPEDFQGLALQLARWQRRARQRRHQELQHPSQLPVPPQQCTLEAASPWGRPRAPGLREGPHLCRRRLAASRSAPYISALRPCLISYSILKQRLHKLGCAKSFCEEGMSCSCKTLQDSRYWQSIPKRTLMVAYCNFDFYGGCVRCRLPARRLTAAAGRARAGARTARRSAPQPTRARACWPRRDRALCGLF